MTHLCNAVDAPCPSLIKSLVLKTPSLRFSPFLHFTTNLKNNSKNLTLTSKPPLTTHPSPPRRRYLIRATAVPAASESEIDMVRNRHGIYTPKQSKVVVLWDLDNKPPRGPPYSAAMALKGVAQKFGEVMEMAAYANRHAFIHLPQWVVDERRERKQLDILERKGHVTPPQPYICGVCGRKCKSNLDLKKHFKQLHERERQKKLNRMKSLKGKKRQRFKERFISGNHEYNEEVTRLMSPKVGYGLAAELRRAGVYVKTVKDKPQAADLALKKQIEHSMTRGIDWVVLVSDDSDFSEILRKAREASLGMVVVGNTYRALGRHADLWVPWIGVENGEVTEKDLMPKSRRRTEDLETNDVFFSVTHFDGEEGDLDSLVDEFVAGRSEFNGVRISAFSEGVEEKEDDQDYLLWDSEDGEIEEEDGDFDLQNMFW